MMDDNKKPVFSSKEDASLDFSSAPISKKPRISKAMVKWGVICLVFLIFVGLSRVFLPKEEKIAEKEKRSEEINSTIPSEVRLESDDYEKQFQEEEPIGRFSRESLFSFLGSNDVQNNDVQNGRYESDDRRPQEQVVAVQARDDQSIFGQQTESESQESEDQIASESPILFQVTMVPERIIPEKEEGVDPSLNVMKTDYENLNQHSQKVAWLESRRGDYSIYRDTLYTQQVAPGQELYAGTVIPVILITGINSDLPGEIKGQVLSDIYDSFTGNNLLIGKGSIVFGKYDSQISFGQSRILFAWDRITRTDGITVTLGGMQGVDMAGMSGVSGEVDYHYESIVAGVAIGSVFDLAMDIATAGLNSLGVFDFGGDAASIFNDNSATAKTAVDNFVDNTFNRQPIIRVPAGTAVNLLVNRNLIFPLYWESTF